MQDLEPGGHLTREEEHPESSGNRRQLEKALLIVRQQVVAPVLKHGATSE